MSKQNKKVLKIVLIVVAVLVVLGILSSILVGFLFKKGTEKLISSATNDTVKVNTGKDGGEVTIGDKDGDGFKLNTGSNAKLPDGYPKSDVPVYKNAKIVSSSDMTLGETKTYSVVLSTKDSVSEVVSFYKKELSGGDWKSTYSTNSKQGSMLMYQSKSKNLTSTVSASRDKDDKETTITLTVREGEVKD